MNATRAYRKTSRALASGRQVECMAFAKAARLLDEARQTPSDLDAMAEALDFNRLVWTVVQAELMRPRNALPDPLSAAVASLSLYADRTMDKLRQRHDPAGLQALIDIDRDLAAGLMAAPS